MADASTLAEKIRAAAELARNLAPLVEAALAVAGSQDEGEIRAALVELAAANEPLHERVQAKLRG